MTRSIVLPALVLALAVDAHAEWIPDGVPVTTSATGQNFQSAVPDGAGGVILAWEDSRIAATDLYIQRIDASGVPLWGANGRSLCTAPGFQIRPVLIPDGAGGAIIAWYDERLAGNRDVYAQRVTDFGDPLWTPNGVPVCTAPNHQQLVSICSDLAGGAILAWADGRSGGGEDIYAQRLNPQGVPQWTANGVALTTGGGQRSEVVSVSDGIGGAIVGWTDRRNGNWDIYERPINSAGTPLSTNGGVAVCTATGDQQQLAISGAGPIGDFAAYLVWVDPRIGVNQIYARKVANSGTPAWAANGVLCLSTVTGQGTPRAVPDGAGGVIIVFGDPRNANIDIYGQRLNDGGFRLWGVDGIPIATAAGNQTVPVAAPDGEGGVFVAWEDQRSAPTLTDIYAQRISALGAKLWDPAGRPVCTGFELQQRPVIIGDGAGDALVAWADERGLPSRVFAQRIEARYGDWGRPEPLVDSADDRPVDQGGMVTVRWQASQRDQVLQPLVSHYSLWRSADPGAIALDVNSPGSPSAPAEVGPDFEGVALWVEEGVAGASYWEWVGNQPAAYLPAYAMEVPTTRDSVTGDPALHGFRVLAHDASPAPSKIWESNEVSGYSTDDLAPAAPIALTAERPGLDVSLEWNPVTSPDLMHYAIYRSTSPGVAPGPATFVATAADPVALDANAPPATLYYVVTAVDVHGNESPPSNEAVAEFGLTAVDAAGTPAALTLEPVQPNPARGLTRIRFGLPRDAPVRLDLLDVSGRRVRRIARPLAAGWHSFELEPTDEDGRRLASGVYLIGLTVGSTTKWSRLVVLR